MIAIGPSGRPPLALVSDEPAPEPPRRGPQIAPELRHEMTLVTEAGGRRDGSERQPRIPHQLAGSLKPQAPNVVTNRAPAAAMELPSDVHGMDAGSGSELGQRHAIDERVVDALLHEPKPRRAPPADGETASSGIAEEVTHDGVNRAPGTVVAVVDLLPQPAAENGRQLAVKAAGHGRSSGLVDNAVDQARRQLDLHTADGTPTVLVCASPAGSNRTSPGLHTSSHRPTASANPPDVTTVIDAAHAHAIPVIGHLGATSWLEGARLGIDHLTHAVDCRRRRSRSRSGPRTRRR